ncbi:type II toxin-antitoxin system RelE/ParE family toxin [Piscinibacter koreensis]|uniref:Type II toxin-antitoxin system RelE/ParE family toxin n=1 Tax=Piscinibacter koreensis TaxID=2742824 RepID=A0A7Y6NRM0_9BURK|nr:type II toxin-antitoxin system RelE/ParE family toxin [Schlegelella koreensis]NUZ08078.1 type II toxin-antitoxin system RelE/ParE family toxin [Schlegelella koreensis]
MTYAVRFTASAEADLLRLFEFLLARANSLENLEHAQDVIDRLRESILSHLGRSPWSYRKAGHGRSSTRRELIVPSAAAGYVVLYEIDSASSVLILAVRHQREDDYQ